MIFAYIVAIFFAASGLIILLHDIPAFLLYHDKVQAEAVRGERYVRHPHKHIGKYGARPSEDIGTTKAVFLYGSGERKSRATAVNLVGDDNTLVCSGKTYTIKLSPSDPHKCYLPPLQLYKGCSIPAKIFIFVKRLLPKLGALMFLGIAWFTYTNFILE